MKKATKLIYIHGGSGVGKSTLGNKILEDLNQLYGNNSAVLIDQDTFYYKDKPIIEYDNVKEANWDTLDAIDMNLFNERISEFMKLDFSFVIVTGFALRQMHLSANLEILLDYNMTPENAREKMILARQQSKGYKGEKAIKDRKRVEMIVWPYYEVTLKSLRNFTKIDVFDEKGERIPVETLSGQLLRLCITLFSETETMF